MQREGRDKIAAVRAYIFSWKNSREDDSDGMLHCWKEFVAVRLVILFQSFKFVLVCNDYDEGQTVKPASPPPSAYPLTVAVSVHQSPASNTRGLALDARRFAAASSWSILVQAIGLKASEKAFDHAQPEGP